MISNETLQSYINAGKSVILGEKGLVLVLYPDGSAKDSLGNSILPADQGRAGIYATEAERAAVKAYDVLAELSAADDALATLIDDLDIKFTLALAKKTASNIAASTETDYPTVEEFNALLQALKVAGLMNPDQIEGIEFFADAPVTGSLFDEPSIGDHADYTIDSFAWLDGDGSYTEEDEADFEKVYNLSVKFKPAAGKAFAELDAEDITIPSGSELVSITANDDGTVTVIVSWPETQIVELSAVAFTADAPATGENFDIPEVSESAGYTMQSFEWIEGENLYDEEDVAAPETVYQLSVVLAPKTGREFVEEGISVTVPDGSTIVDDPVLEADGSLRVIVVWPETAPDEGSGE